MTKGAQKLYGKFQAETLEGQNTLKDCLEKNA